jgi:hypothetical protein
VNQKRNILRRLALAHAAAFWSSPAQNLPGSSEKSQRQALTPASRFFLHGANQSQEFGHHLPRLQVPVVYYSNNYPTFSRKPA